MQKFVELNLQFEEGRPVSVKCLLVGSLVVIVSIATKYFVRQYLTFFLSPS